MNNTGGVILATINETNGGGDYSPRPRSHPASSGGHEHNHPQQHKRSKGRGVAATIGKVLGTLVLLLVVTGVFLGCYAAIYVKTVIVPQADLSLSNFTLNESSKIYYMDSASGEYKELVTLTGSENRIWADYDTIPDNLKNACVAIEDERFWQHHGVDWKRTAGAFLNMFLQMSNTYGGSTLTQQLIKNLTNEKEVTVKRKILEIVRALEFEKNYSKKDILEWYLNVIYLGEGCYGVQTAAQEYFGKDVSQLSLAQCASLIGITNNPSLYDPYRNEKANKTRQETILGKMKELGYITDDEYTQAMNEKLVFSRGTEQKTTTVYSWYVDAVINEVTTDLMEKFDWSKEVAQKMVLSGGLSIYTPFDPSAQAKVDEVYNDASNLDYTSKDGQKMQSAITVVDNSTGYVVAMSGGVGEKTASLLNNRAVDSQRQPGSSIKPLSVYSPAIELGLVTPGTVIDDCPILLGGKAWPKNSPQGYKGLMTVYNALTNSVNTVAVKLMKDYVTPDVSYQFLCDRYGMKDYLVSYRETNSGKVVSDIDVAPLALGGLTDGVTSFSMTAAYATFARNGAYTTPTTYLTVLNNDGSVLVDNTPETNYVLKESTVYYMDKMLQNVVAAGTGTAAKISGMTTAGKTGTTSSNYDRWFAGFTPYYTAVVWTGYDTPAVMNTSGNPAVGMWQKVMSKLVDGKEDKSFSKPSDLVTVSICADCGLLATENCALDSRGSRAVSYTFVNGDQPTEYCTCHELIKVCTDSPILSSDGTPTGRYHLATDFCPADSVRTIAVVNYNRSLPASGISVADSIYLKSYYDNLADPYCTVHTSATQEPAATDDPSATTSPDPGAEPTSTAGTEPSTSPSASVAPEDDPWYGGDKPGTGNYVPAGQ